MSTKSRIAAVSLALTGLIPLACSSQPDSSRSASESPAELSEALTSAQANLAQWGSLVTLPIVPVSGANLPDGTVLLWSAEDPFNFQDDLQRTYTVLFNPTTGVATQRLVAETQHDMFCPGTANLPDGKILVNGGMSSGTTSVYDPLTATWTRMDDMNITRAYQGTTPLWDGSVFTLGGSWRGGLGDKHGELWTPNDWRKLPDVRIDRFLSVDNTRAFGMDSHLWLLPAGNGRVFHAGPGVNMNWVHTTGNGGVQPIGRRGDDEFSINGNAVMFDTGKVLKVGGAPGYDGLASNGNAYVIELGSNVTVRKLPPMVYRRGFHNSVVLPNGQVVIVGGATIASGFSDGNSVLAPEIFDPLTETFTVLPAMAAPRNYHSIALLLPDGRVLSAGGGLCGVGCSANHPDLQILSPPYLFNANGTPATRPAITAGPAQAVHGALMNVTTNGPISAFSLVRMSSSTHALNNDQRRLSLSFSETSPNHYALQVPSNPGWAVPGLYMLFAMNAAGVPSIAHTVRIGSTTILPLVPVPDQSVSLGASTSLALSATSPSGNPLVFGASGLPAGLSLNTATGVISGTATSLGRSLVEVSATDSVQTISTQFNWDVYEPGLVRFVRFESLSEVNGNPWATAAEINVLDKEGLPLPRGGWSITADSAELVGSNGAPINAIDGNPASIWYTLWQAGAPPHPHWLRIDLGGAYQLSGLRYLPRSDGPTAGMIANYAVKVSADGVNWGSPVAQGNFTALGANNVEKTVYFQNLARNKSATQSSTAGAALATLAVDGNTNGVLASGSVSLTNSEASAWWEVDLGASYKLFALRLWNRTDVAALSNFRIFTAASPMGSRTVTDLETDPEVSTVTVPGTSPTVALHTLSGVSRYVRVQRAGSGALGLAEVEVHGRAADNQAPSLAQPSPGLIGVGTPASLQLQGSDPDGDTLTYSASSLPLGLLLNTSSGLISGTPTTSGTYHVTAGVSDGHGGSASVQFDWVVGVNPPTVSPVIAPLASSGSSIHYTANASGGAGLQYSWSFGDGTAASGFSSSPEINHTFTKPGVYIVTLTVRNAQGEAVSTEFVQAIVGPAIAGRPRVSSNLVEELRPGQSPRFWTANIDNDTVSVFNRQGLGKVAEIPVGTSPRSLAVAPDGRIWVANKGSSTLSVINPVSLSVVQTVTLVTGSQPFGLVCAEDGSVYVALEGTGEALKLDAAGVQLAKRVVAPSPRHLALSAAGDKVFMTRFISPPQPGEATAFVETNVAGVKKGGELMVLSPTTLGKTRTIVLQHSDKPDSTIAGRGVPNYLGAPAISPDGLTAWVPSKQDNIQRGSLRDAQNLDFQNTVRAISSRVDLKTSKEDYAGRLDFDNSGVASAAAYHPSGAYLFVALEASRQVSVVDAAGKRELFRAEAGLAPQAVAVSADGHTLYVHNALGRSVSVFDLSPLIDTGARTLPLLGELDAVAVEKLSASVLHGKQLFYDARDTRLARDAYLSCAACHNDGGQDGRVWDLTGMGEGLRNTVNLRGRAGAQGRLHWTANFDEVQDFEGQIRALSQGSGLMTDAAFAIGTRSQPLGDPKAGISADLDALAAYVGSLNTADASPYRLATGDMTKNGVLGRTVFARECITCHGNPEFSDSPGLAFRNIGTLRPSSGNRLGEPLFGLDTPGLRGSWATAPYLHDGSAATLSAAILAHGGITLTATDQARVTAFVQQLDAAEPSVGPLPGLMAQYFGNSTLSGPAAYSRPELVKYNWAAGGPTGLPVDGFSVRWTGKVVAPTTGNYRFQTRADDGVRLWVNGVLAIDTWNTPGLLTTNTADIPLSAGQRYDIKLEYHEVGGTASIQLNWLVPGTTKYVVMPLTALEQAGVGLTAQYFANNSLSGAATLVRYESPHFTWGSPAPDPSLPEDNFSVRWTGTFLSPGNGAYLFETHSDDGVRLWINNTLVIDNWTSHAPTIDSSGPINLVAGQRYDIKLEFQELTGGAVMRLEWKPPGEPFFGALPVSRLYAN